MKIPARVATVVLMLVFSAVAQTANSVDKPVPPAADKSAVATKLQPVWFKAVGNHGGWWNNITEGEKDAFIDGFTTAMAKANSALVGISEATMKDVKPGAANFNERLQEVIALQVLGQEFDFKLDKPLKPRLDEFYKDPLNVRIPVEFAMDYVRDEMFGKKTAGQLLDELNDWRKIVNH